MRHSFPLPALLLAAMVFVAGCKDKENPDETNYQLSAEPQSLIFLGSGGSQTVSVTTDAPSWTASPSETWITTSTSGDKLTVMVSENKTNESRKGSVKITAGSSSTDISVTQGGKVNRPADDPYPEAEYGLADHTVFVPESMCKAITSADPDAKTFTVPISKTGNIKPEKGLKLIMNTPTDVFPDGLLAEVTDVRESGGNYVVSYRMIALEKAFTDLRIDETELDLSSHLLRIEDASGKEVHFTRTRDIDKKTYHIEIPAASWPLPFAGLEIAPIMSADVTMTLQTVISGGDMYVFNMNVQTDLHIGATVAMGAEGKVIDERKPLYTMFFAAIPVGPVLVTPFIQLSAVYYVSGKVSIEATVKYHTVQTQGVHYDINTGWSANDFSARNNNGEWEEVSISPKIEGSVAYGLGLGPYVGIYGKVVAVGVSFDTLIKETVSEAFDLLNGDPSQYLDWSFIRHLQNIEYTGAVVGAASFDVELVGLDAASIESPEFTLASNTIKILPFVNDNFSFERTDEGMELTIEVENPHFITGGVYALFKENAESPDSEARKVRFIGSQDDLAGLNSKAYKKVTLKTTADLDEEDGDLQYADILLESSMLSSPVCLASLEQQYDDTEARAALLKILEDLYRARDGEWDGCNWFTTNRPVSTMKNIRMSYRNGEFRYRITLPADWKVGKDLYVGNYSENAARFGSWTLVFEGGSGSAIENFSIQDAHFKRATIDNNIIDYFCVNSPLWDSVEDIPASVRLLDLSRTAITEFASSRIGDNLRDVVVADCKSLKTLTLGPNAAPNVSNLLYTATGCDLLESITLQHIDFEKTYFLHNERGNGKAELVIDRCTLDDNDFPGNFPSVRIANSTFGTLSFEDNKVTESVDLRDSKGKGLFVKKCPKMRSILCPDSGISTFVVENLPDMNYIDVENNDKLLSLVPEVFDQIQDCGGTVRYDIRYAYEDDGSGVIRFTDNGYGFWYENEPGCGFHGKEPPEDEDEGYVIHPGEGAARTAFRKVLQDLYRCRKGEWEGCDWLDGSKGLGSLQNVSAPETESANETYTVTIPENWQFGPDVLVKKHNKQPTQQYGGETGHYEDWVLRVQGERTYNSITISDPRCYQVVIPGEAQTFAVHSPGFFFQARGSEPYKYRSIEIPSKIHTLDLRGCGSYELDYNWDYAHMPKVIKMRRYDGKDTGGSDPRVYVTFSDPTPQPMPSITIEGNGYRIDVTNATLPYGELPVKVDNLLGLCLYSCKGDMIYAPENVKYMAVGAESGNTVNNMPLAKGISSIKEVKVQDKPLILGVDLKVEETATVESCPLLEDVYGHAGFTYTVRSCPAVDYIGVSARDLKIQDCEKLKNLYYPDTYGSVNNLEADNCPALEEVNFKRNTALQSINLTNVPALKDVDLGRCTSLTMAVPSFFFEIWNRNGYLDYEERYTYTYGSGPYTTAQGHKFDYTDNGYGFYFADEPTRGYHRYEY